MHSDHAPPRDVASSSRVLVALSGGADSVALFFILRELEAAGMLSVAGAAHLHHGLRGAEADADEAFCAGLAARIGVPFVSERADVAALARAGKRSIEDAARTARYAFLERAAAGLGAGVTAVAHTKDDQAETFLLRLLRGAGTRGLGGIRPRAGRIVRPLLDLERGELRGYLTARGETWREDSAMRIAIPTIACGTAASVAPDHDFHRRLRPCSPMTRSRNGKFSSRKIGGGTDEDGRGHHAEMPRCLRGAARAQREW